MSDIKSETIEEKVDPIVGMEEKKAAYEKELDELFEQLSEGGYFKQTYGEDSIVTMKGTLFSSLINFINDHKRSLYTIQQILNLLATTSDAMLTDNSAVTIELMKTHKENVDNGNSITMEDMDKEDATKKVNVTERKSRKPKSKGSSN